MPIGVLSSYYIFKREFNKQLHYQLIRQNLSLMDEFYFFAERMD